jgi:ribulose 1,5-bisphosphate synthetase/thiazole synthase
MAQSNGNTNGHTNGSTQRPERIVKSELSQYARRRRTDGPYADNLDLDVLVVGAGFSGTYLLYEMRKQGYNTVLYDAGLGFGGTW